LLLSMRRLFFAQIINANAERTLELSIKPRSFRFLRVHTKYEAAEHLLLHRTKAVVTLAAAWCSPPPGFLGRRFGIPGCRKDVIFGRLVHRLAAMYASKLHYFCHPPILFQDPAQNQNMHGSRPRPAAPARETTRLIQPPSGLPAHLLSTALALREHPSATIMHQVILPDFVGLKPVYEV